MHPNAEISLLIQQSEELCFTILQVGGSGGGGGGAGGDAAGAGGGGAGGGGGAAGAKEERARQIQTQLVEQVREPFNLVEIKLRVKDKGAPYVVFLLQELERMNLCLTTIKQQVGSTVHPPYPALPHPNPT